ncbi:MAG: DNA mismatch endonuclease Vsr [Pseudogulbenkiania sp.]|nr:DNA mismatch endonuclease Vsr [Pseudogulbenkiania sp.]
MDKISSEQRSRLMSKIRGKNTSPELKIRKMLHTAGYRFRLHRKDLPGRPDIVLPKHKLCIFVHGCFWHSHPGCKRSTIPQTNREFWEQKLASNRARDIANISALQQAGWRVCVIWECEVRANIDLSAVVSRCFE